ncbi:MAG TPA: VCBS repeat-containing protein, partial [Chitinophagaceae bacterium]|nr:VCBS repeat-containing protein [Chitinophagaceae bacterium]
MKKVIFLVMAFICYSQIKGQLCFTNSSTPSVSSLPHSITAADFNGDGKADMAISFGDLTSNFVSVLLGNGDGTFGSATNFVVGSRPFFIINADFNGDGKIDLATANGGGGDDISVLLGNGDGSFAPPFNYSTGDAPQTLAAADFNGDGKKDLAVVNQNSHNVSILLGAGTGSFASAVNFSAVESSPYSITVADFNSDGKIDLALSHSTSNKISVHLGNGTGSFSYFSTFLVGNEVYSVANGDFNGDGKKDLATANTASNNISIMLGNGAGSFGTATNYPTGNSPRVVVPGDINSDGKTDLVAANFGNENISVFLGDGFGSFGLATNFTVGNHPISIAITNFNADNKPDMAVVNHHGNSVSVLVNSPTVNAGNDAIVFFGGSTITQGLDCTTLIATASSGAAAGSSFSWSSDPASNIPNNTSNQIIVCPTVNTNYIVTYTTPYGCVASDTVLVKAIDVSCGNNNTKVKICITTPSGQHSTICVATSAVESVLANNPNAVLGDCSAYNARITDIVSEEVKSRELKVYPNPSHTYFTLQIGSEIADQKISLRVLNLKGRVVETRNNLT